MKARRIGYWVVTGLFSLALAGSAAADLVRPPEFVEGMTRLGYPAYLPLILGFWKVLGVAAILAPRMPRLKEWAYAGFFFELTGAVFSHVAAGDAAHLGVPALLALLGMASWALRPESRRFAVVSATTQSVAVAIPEPAE